MKALRKLSKFLTLDEVSRFASDIIEAWNALAKDRFLSRKELVVSLTAGSNVISHSLGYAPKGYLIVNQSAASTFYSTQSTTTTITIVASANVTVTIEVF